MSHPFDPGYVAEPFLTLCADYPEARGHLYYGGTRRYRFDAIEVLPLAEGLREIGDELCGQADSPD